MEGDTPSSEVGRTFEFSELWWDVTMTEFIGKFALTSWKLTIQYFKQIGGMYHHSGVCVFFSFFFFLNQSSEHSYLQLMSELSSIFNVTFLFILYNTVPNCRDKQMWHTNECNKCFFPLNLWAGGFSCSALALN